MAKKKLLKTQPKRPLNTTRAAGHALDAVDFAYGGGWTRQFALQNKAIADAIDALAMRVPPLGVVLKSAGGAGKVSRARTPLGQLADRLKR